MTTILYGMPHGRYFHLHNGMVVYCETGKCSPGMPQAWHIDDKLPAVGIHEGEWLAEMLFDYSQWLYDNDTKVSEQSHLLSSSAPEYPPKARAEAVNLLLPHIDGDVIYIEPHCNASGNEWSDAQGHKVFYNDAARKYALPLSNAIARNKAQDTRERAPRLAPRGWWLDEIKCPAMYLESFFMTNKYETKIAMDFVGMQGIYMGLYDFHREVM